MRIISSFKLFCLLIVGLTFLSPHADAQKLSANLDWAFFRYDSTRTYTELYYSFNPGALHLVKVEKGDLAEAGTSVDSLLFEVSISRGDSLVSRQVWKSPVSIPDTNQADMRRSFVGKADFVLRPGNYLLAARCADVNDLSKSCSMSVDLPVPSYAGEKLESSSIELCSTISPGDGGGIFYKNTYNVVPNPGGIFGVGMPIIYYYLEVYNISSKAGDSVFTAGYEVRDSYGQVKKASFKTRKKFGSSSVEVGTVNGSNLKTGAYTFIYTVIDSSANEYAASSKRFFVYNPNLGNPETPDSGVSSGALLSSVYAAMGEEQLDKEFAEARYISTSAEREQFEKLKTINEKRQFLYEFWKKRNTEPDSRTNDARIKYLERVAYANQHFRAGVREGWETDRGRIYILYGNPDEIDRHPNETDSKPYEIWYYNSLEGGVSFDFIDRTGFGDYSLVNSTKRNEIHDSSWQQYLSQ